MQKEYAAQYFPPSKRMEIRHDLSRSSIKFKQRPTAGNNEKDIFCNWNYLLTCLDFKDHSMLNSGNNVISDTTHIESAGKSYFESFADGPAAGIAL